MVIRVMFYSGASWYSNVLSWDEVLIGILMLGLGGNIHVYAGVRW